MSKKTGIIAAVMALVVGAVAVGSYYLDGGDLLGSMRKKSRFTRPTTSISRTVRSIPVQEHGSVSVSLNSSALSGFLNPATSQEIFKFDVKVSGEESVVLKNMQLKCDNNNPNKKIKGGKLKIYVDGRLLVAENTNDHWCVSGLETKLDYKIGEGETKTIEVKYNTLGLNIHPYASDPYIFQLQELEVEYLQSKDKQMAEGLPLNGKLLEYY